MQKSSNDKLIPGELYKIEDVNRESLIVLYPHKGRCFQLPNNTICLFIGTMKNDSFFADNECYKFMYNNTIFRSGIEFAHSYWKMTLIC